MSGSTLTLSPTRTDIAQSVRDIVRSLVPDGDHVLNTLTSLVLAGHAESESICWVIGKLGKKSIALKLLNVFRDEARPTRVRVAAAIAMSELSNRRTVLPLIRDLQSGNEFLKTQAAYVLGWSNDARAIGPLAELLSNTREVSSARCNAAEALGHLAMTLPLGKPVIDTLIRELDDPDNAVRFWAAFALGNGGDESAIPKLRIVAATDHADVPDWGTVAAEAEEAIGLINQRLLLPSP